MMKSTNVTTMAIMLIAGMGCGSSLPKFDATKPIQTESVLLGAQYQQNGQTIDGEDMAVKLLQEPRAAAHVERSRTMGVISAIFLGVGSGLTSIPTGQWAAESSDPNWTLAICGGLATLAAIPFAVASNSSMSYAVDAHNEMLTTKDKASGMNSNSAATWKPGQRAGVPSAFGFVLGSSKTDAADACQKAGHQWSETDGLFRCSGVPSKAIVGGWAQITFTKDKLSALEILIIPPGDAPGWVETLKNTGSALTNAYGKPMQRSFVVPDECKPEEVFLNCVAEGKVTGTALWYPDSDYAAVLDIVSAPLPSTSIVRLKIARRPPLGTTPAQ